MPEEEVGIVDHWFGHLNVAGVRITNGSIKPGDTLHFKGHTTDFQETIGSVQLEHEDVPEGKAGDDVGIKISQKVRPHDKVFKVT